MVVYFHDYSLLTFNIFVLTLLYFCWIFLRILNLVLIDFFPSILLLTIWNILITNTLTRINISAGKLPVLGVILILVLYYFGLTFAGDRIFLFQVVCHYIFKSSTRKNIISGVLLMFSVQFSVDILMINFQNIWIKLQPRAQYLRKTLVFSWNSALREKFNFYFQGVFCKYWQNFLFWRKTGH